MTYGLKLFNDQGETVVDDEYPTYVLQSATTVSGTLQSAGLYYYPLDASKAQFFNIGVGQFLLAVRAVVATDIILERFYSNAATLQTRIAIPSNELPAPDGYGVSVTNSAGELCYTSNSALINVTDYYEANQDMSLVSCPNSWISIVDNPLINVLDDGSGFGVSVASGVNRANSGQYHYWERQVSNGFPVTYIGNTPVRFLAAA